MMLFKGNHFETGQQIGRYYAQHKVVPYPVISPDLLKQQLLYHEEFAPEIIEELQGIADGGNYAFEQIAHEALVSGILYFREEPAKSCSIGGFTDRDNRAWVVRNYDWHPLVSKNFQMWRFELPGVSVAAISDMCISCAQDADKKEQRFYFDDAINSHGLFIGLTYAHSNVTGIGMPFSAIMKLVSWRCKNVEDALELFSTIKLCCPKNFFLSDAAGRMAVVEHAVDDMRIRMPDQDGVLVLTNHYMEELNAFDLVPLDDSTFDRYSRLSRDLRERVHSNTPGDFDRLDAMMSNPESPVCQFFPDLEVETVWTLLLEVKAQKFRLIGNPRSSGRAVTNFSVLPQQ